MHDERPLERSRVERAAPRGEALSSTAAALLEAIEARAARVGVIGLGHVGLPLVEAVVEAGFPVRGFDTDPGKIEQLRAGASYIERVPSRWLEGALREGRLEVAADFSLLGGCDVVIVCVPTPLTRQREPDLSYLQGTARAIAERLRPGQLIAVESTTFPGTTEEVIQPILEASGLRAGRDFFLAYSPEREDPGNPRYSTRTIPRVVGGVDPLSGRLATALYGAVACRVFEASHARVAEASKILENVYRAVNIALVNELKVLFERMGIDIWEVVDAASTKPFGFQAFRPGPGLGGHCIPIDPFYLTWKAREFGLSTRFVELAGEINTQMPAYVVERVVEAMNSRGKALLESRGLILGVAYKPNVDDVRESPAFRIMELLEQRGANLLFHDPHVAALPAMRRYRVHARPTPLDARALGSVDFVVIVTDHDGIDWEMVVREAPLVIDTRGVTRGLAGGEGKVVRA